MTQTAENETYYSECHDCEWSYEHPWHGKVEKNALNHMDNKNHSATQPRPMSNTADETDGNPEPAEHSQGSGTEAFDGRGAADE